MAEQGISSRHPPPVATILRAGIEDMEPDQWVVSVFDLTGCFSSGRTEEEAIAQTERRVQEYFTWLGKKDGNPAPFEDSVRIVISERFLAQPWPKNPNRMVHACYEDDQRPLRLWDVELALRLLDWNRQDLLLLLGKMMPDSLYQLKNAPQWNTIDGLLGHLWETENVFLGNLNAAVEPAQLTGDPMSKVEVVRGRLKDILPAWIGEETVRELNGENWTPRKVLRRALWHERDHIGQLEKINLEDA